MIFRNTATRTAAAMTILATTLLVVGCAGPYKSGGPEAIVKERAEQRWQSLLKGDFDAVYKLTTPSYRAVSSLERFRGKFGNAAQWTDANVVSVNCEPKKCLVTLEVEARPVARGSLKDPVSTAVKETWVEEEGQWWLYQRL